MFAQKELKRRHEKLCRHIHCAKHMVSQREDMQYKHIPEVVWKNEYVEIL